MDLNCGARKEVIFHLQVLKQVYVKAVLALLDEIETLEESGDSDDE